MGVNSHAAKRAGYHKAGINPLFFSLQTAPRFSGRKNTEVFKIARINSPAISPWWCGGLGLYCRLKLSSSKVPRIDELGINCESPSVTKDLDIR